MSPSWDKRGVGGCIQVFHLLIVIKSAKIQLSMESNNARTTA